jgi:hypothetical protein
VIPRPTTTRSAVGAGAQPSSLPTTLGSRLSASGSLTGAFFYLRTAGMPLSVLHGVRKGFRPITLKQMYTQNLRGGAAILIVP